MIPHVHLGWRLVVGVLLSSLFGCGASALSLQADMVAAGGIVAADADIVIVDARAAELQVTLDHARAVCASGCDDTSKAELRAERDAVRARWAPVLECREPVVEALRGWADGLETAHAVSDDDVGLALLLRLAGRFVKAWRSLDACLGAAAPSVDLPDLPASLAGIGGAS